LQFIELLGLNKESIWNRTPGRYKLGVRSGATQIKKISESAGESCGAVTGERSNTEKSVTMTEKVAEQPQTRGATQIEISMTMDEKVAGQSQARRGTQNEKSVTIEEKVAEQPQTRGVTQIEISMAMDEKVAGQSQARGATQIKAQADVSGRHMVSPSGQQDNGGGFSKPRFFKRRYLIFLNIQVGRFYIGLYSVSFIRLLCIRNVPNTGY
jgi:hypothetical protein